MIEPNFEKQYATNHYAFYPKGDFPIYLAYGFRPIFLLLAPYIVLSIILTLLGGIIPSKKAAKEDPVTALRTD